MLLLLWSELHLISKRWSCLPQHIVPVNLLGVMYSEYCDTCSQIYSYGIQLIFVTRKFYPFTDSNSEFL